MDQYNASLNAWAPRVLSLLRILVGLMFLQHGLSKFFGFPSPFAGGTPAFPSMLWFAAAIEIVAGALVAVGLFTRPAALIASGEMAVAYLIYTGRLSRSFFPLANGGNLEVLYCFAFFYLVFAGPGPWSVDALRTRNP